jgi:hypothetical protein
LQLAFSTSFSPTSLLGMGEELATISLAYECQELETQARSFPATQYQT